MALVLSESESASLREAIAGVLRQGDAKCAILVDQDGVCLVKEGLTQTFDCDALAALIAGSFASTRAMAQLVGEAEFSVLFHQGEKDHIHNILVDDSTILAVIFDERTTVGMIRLYSKEAAKKMRGVLKGARGRKTGGVSGDEASREAAKEARSRIDDIFKS